MKKSALAGIFIVIAIGLYAFLAFIGDVNRTTEVLVSFSFQDWTVILGFSLVNYAIRYLRWERYIVLASGVRPERWRHVLVYLGGFALTTTPGKAGEAIRSFYLRAYAVPVTASLSAFAVERIMDLLTIAMLATLIAGESPTFRWLILAAMATIFLVILLLQGKRAVTWTRKAANCCHGRSRKLVHGIAKTLSSSSTLMRPPMAAAGLISGLLAWGCEGVAFTYVLHVLGADLPAVYAIGVYALAMLVGALSFVPGGLGGTEVAMTLLLVARGTPLDVGVAATMICRVATLWFAVLLGVTALLILSCLRPNVLAGNRA